MIRALWRFIEDPSHRESAEESEQEQEQALRLATAALLFEAVRADGRIEDSERSVMRAAIQSTFDLPPSEIDDLVRVAETASRAAVSLYEFTTRVDKAFSPEQKKRIVELLWLVTFADAQKDALEEHLVRKIAGLLHVSHPDFIDAKIREVTQNPARAFGILGAQPRARRARPAVALGTRRAKTGRVPN